MNRILLLFILSTIALFSVNRGELTVNGHTFILEKEDYDEYGSKGKTVTFYRKDNNGSKSSLFSFVLDDVTGGCNDKSVEKGVYEVNGTTVTFYTLWRRVGSIDDAPFGGRIKRYSVLKSGEVKLVSSYLYIEEHTKCSNLKSGMRFLFEEAKTAKEKKLFKEYIASIERRYKGKFVFDKESNRLIQDVRDALKRKIKSRWKKR